MRALILAAGLGTRLRPLTSVRAKAAVPVNGTPLVRRVIAELARQGIVDLVVNLHHRPESIAAVVGDGQELGVRVRYSWEHPVLGSAGGPRHALPLLIDRAGAAASSVDSFLMVNGDTLTSVKLDPLLDVHHRSGALVTMALIRNPRPEKYGGVVVEQGRVTGFSRPGVGGESFHFIGVQAARASAFADLEDGVPAESVMGLYPRLISERWDAVAAHVVEAPFSDIGTPADYLQTCLELAGREGEQLVSGIEGDIHPSVELVRTAVWDRVRIGADSRLNDCILCDGATLPAGSRYERCAMVPFEGQPIQDDEWVEGAVLMRKF